MNNTGENFPLENLLPNVPRGTLVPIKKYLELLFLWKEKINLTGAKTPEEYCHQHVLDCFQAAGVLSPMETWLDVGSGAGLPGIIWSLIKPREKFYLLEGNKKKASFLQRVVSVLSLSNVNVLPHRLENLTEEWIRKLNLNPLACVSRGTADPIQLLKLASSTQFSWQDWFVFSSKNTHELFLTHAKKFAMKVEALRYSKGLEEEDPKTGMLTKLTRK